MTYGPVLVIGLDPVRIPGWDPAPVVAAITRGHARFAEHGIEADLCLTATDAAAEEPLLEFFEQVINLVHRHAPDAAIAFNSTPEDTVDAALRRLG